MATFGATAVVVPFAARAQQKKMPVVGWLHNPRRPKRSVINALREKARGWLHRGENIAIKYAGQRVLIA
jgi:hypothetical protein